MEKVVITGTGAVCAVGNNSEDVWQNMLSGKSGVGPISYFDTSDSLVKVACEVKGFYTCIYKTHNIFVHLTGVPLRSTPSGEKGGPRSKMQS